jgi:hypothetical protein
MLIENMIFLNFRYIQYSHLIYTGRSIHCMHSLPIFDRSITSISLAKKYSLLRERAKNLLFLAISNPLDVSHDMFFYVW